MTVKTFLGFQFVAREKKSSGICLEFNKIYADIHANFHINFIEINRYTVIINPACHDKCIRLEEFSEKFHPAKCQMFNK